MRETTERDSLTIDDLIVGRRYEFITPRGHAHYGTWEGMDGHNGGVRFPPGAIDLFPHGTTLVYPVRYWAACTITAIEPLHATEERLDFNENLRRHLAACRAAAAKRARPWRLACLVVVAIVAAAVAAWIWWR